MCPNLASILQCCRRIGKCISAVCPTCGNSHFCPKAGSYRRYCPYRKDRIRIQRYLCRNPKFSAVTFSVLPAFLLPVVRFSFTMLLLVSILAPHHSINALAKRFDRARSTIRSILRLGDRICSWVTDTGILKLLESWSEFGALFSRAFFPDRLRRRGTNTTPPIPHGKRIS